MTRPRHLRASFFIASCFVALTSLAACGDDTASSGGGAAAPGGSSSKGGSSSGTGGTSSAGGASTGKGNGGSVAAGGGASSAGGNPGGTSAGGAPGAAGNDSGAGGMTFGGGPAGAAGMSTGTAGSSTGTGGSSTGTGGSPMGTAGMTGTAGTSGGTTCGGDVNSCFSCCDSTYPAGAMAYNQDVSSCACAGPCSSACASACQGGNIDSSCDACLTTAFQTGQCGFPSCQNNAECGQFVECAQACQGGGSGGGGQGGSSGGTGGSGAGAGTGSGGAVSSSASDLCFETINMYRAKEGLPPYQHWVDGESCASNQCKSDSESGTAHGAFGMCGEWAQNECPGWPGSPEGIITGCLEMMYNEKFTGEQGMGHYKNMTSTQYTRVACGFYVTPGGEVWAIQNFQ